MRNRYVRSFTAVLALSLLGVSSLYAQAGSISGRITNADTGAPIPGARVDLTGPPTGGVITGTLADAQGRYRITNVAPGTYSIAVALIGYEQQLIENVRVAAGEVTTLNLTLAPRAVALNPVVVSASRRQERAQEAPASVSVVGARQIEARPAVSPAEHIRATPGVDIAQTGIQNANVVVRGFNAAFTSSLSYLTDYRIASVPGLQVNRFGSLSLSNEDIERIEVVLGPGAALYGPNTANGVLHVLSKSPLTFPGTSASVSVGERDVFMGNFRTAHRVNDNLGIKFSGQYFRGSEWPFVDTAEVRLQTQARAQIEQFRAAQLALGRSEQQIQDSIARNVDLFSLTRIGERPTDASRYGFDGRVDWNPLPGVGTVFQVGRSSNTSVDLTGISASVQDEFSVSYYQGRMSTGRLFAQVYMEENDAGGTYTARTGAPVFDESRLWVAQLQHGFALWGDRQNFIYGLDWIHTIPESQGTVYGRNEENDEVTQTGVYLQSETRLLPSLNLVMAGRFDQHSVIEDNVFSPRVGLVFTPIEGQTFRATYNRAFQAPTAINLFLDRLSSQSGPFAVRAIGTGAHGWNFRLDDGTLAFRSPFNSPAAGGMNQRLPYDPATVSRLAINFMASPALPAVLRLTPAEAGRLFAANPSFTVVGRNPQTGQLGVPFNPASVENLPGLKPEISEVFEVGYRGLIGNRFLITADVWYLQRENFISQLFAPAPMLLLPQPQIRQFLEANGITGVRADSLAAIAGRTPMGVVAAAENDVLTGEVPILITYKNYAQVDLTGLDFSAQALFGVWRVGATASFVSDDYFTFGPTEQPIALNSPKRKGSLTLGYENPGTGVTGELRGRYTGEFPVYSGVYIGNRCVEPEQGLGECVQAATLLDLTLGYRLRQLPGTTFQLGATNLLNEMHQSFVGVPPVGRLVVLRAKYEF